MGSTLVLAGSGLPHLHVLEAFSRGRLGQARVVLVAPRQLKACAGNAVRADRGPLQAGPIESGALPARARGRGRVRGGSGPAGGLQRSGRSSWRTAPSWTTTLPRSPSAWSPPASGFPGSLDNARLLKPMDRATEIVQALDGVVAATPGEGPRVIVVGAGMEGLETALALRRRLDRTGPRGRRGHGGRGRLDGSFRTGQPVCPGGPRCAAFQWRDADPRRPGRPRLTPSDSPWPTAPAYLSTC